MSADVKEWVRAYPYTALATAAALLLILGGSFVALRAQNAPAQEPRVWGGTGSTLIDPISYTPNAVLETQYAYSNATDTPIAIYTSNQTTGTKTDEIDYATLLGMLSVTNKPSEPRPSTPSDTVGLAYSFIPQGLLSTTSPSRERTPVQQALFEYGNAAGSSIQSYEVLHRDDPVKLRDQAEDRQNPEKAAMVRGIAQSMQSLGQSLARMEDVPSAIQAYHEKLAHGYITIGERLAQVPDAQTDEGFIAAIQSYNTAVEAFIRSYVGIAEIFSAYGVTFAAHEPGSVFVFVNAAL